MKEKKKKFIVNLKELATLVTYLDGYSALSVIDPAKIRRIIKKNSEDRDIEAVWKEIENDVFDISTLPSTSENIMKLSRRLEILKPLSMFLPLILFVVYIALEVLGVMKNLGQVGTIAFLVILLVAYVAGFSSYILMNRKLTREVGKYYERHMGEVSKQRRRIKLANQRLIDKLAMSIRARKSDPAGYRFELLHNDYGN
ncbi:MAG: hypothetical protein ACRECH_04680, partial [Nitrososphaerales archaeon]